MPLPTAAICASAVAFTAVGWNDASVAAKLSPHRLSVTLAREIQTLWHLSGGRFVLGVGPGWDRHEFDTLGMKLGERGRRTDEIIAALRRLLTERDVSFAGKHYRFEHVTIDLQVTRIEPEHYFSYRWHPYAIDPNVDYSTEPTTLVEFHLDEIDDGKATAVTIVESGFDQIPLARRAEAFRMNDGGWTSQAKKLAAYVA